MDRAGDNQHRNAKSNLNDIILQAKRVALRLSMLSLWMLAYPLCNSIQLPASANLLPTSTSRLQSTGYILGVGDRIRLDIFNVPEYSGEFEVLVDGSLNLPVIGPVFVQGLTLQQASNLVSENFSNILRRPIVTLSLLETRPLTVAIAGEINRPGSYTFSQDTTSQVPSLTHALQMAGGVTQIADLRQIQIRRILPNGTGTTQTLTIDLWQLVQAGNLQQDLLLRDGDSIFIPTTTALDLDQARQLANTSFSASQSSPISVAIVGEVLRPGPYILSAAASTTTGAIVPTVTQAIQQAGGITQSANIRNIEIRRTVHSGEEQTIQINLWDLLQAGELEQDLPLQTGDTIVVPTATALSPEEMLELSSASFSPDTIKVNVVGEVVRPGAVDLAPNTPLNQALLAAGGFNNRARRETVTLIRLNPDGTALRRTISVDFDQGLNTEDNPALRPNDTIVVGRSPLAGLGDTLSTVLTPITGVFTLLRLFGGL
jgi:polysaccharide export outer membrane protein